MKQLTDAIGNLGYSLEAIAGQARRAQVALISDVAPRLEHIAAEAEALANEARRLADEARDIERRV